MQTWEYKTLLAPDTTLMEFQEKHWAGGAEATVWSELLTL